MEVSVLSDPIYPKFTAVEHSHASTTCTRRYSSEFSCPCNPNEAAEKVQDSDLLVKYRGKSARKKMLKSENPIPDERFLTSEKRYETVDRNYRTATRPRRKNEKKCQESTRCVENLPFSSTEKRSRTIFSAHFHGQHHSVQRTQFTPSQSAESFFQLK